jgi:hypothetical protein
MPPTLKLKPFVAFFFRLTFGFIVLVWKLEERCFHATADFVPFIAAGQLLSLITTSHE